MTRRLVSILAAALMMVLISAAPASAHATLVSSNPADGSVTDHSPTEIELNFNEPVSVESSTVELVDVDGTVHDARIIGPGSSDSTLVVDIGEAPDGLYSLKWTALSSSDGHVTRGMLVWGFGQDADLSQASFPDVSKPISPIEVTLRWALFAGLAGVLGGLLIDRLVLEPLRLRFAAHTEEDWHWDSARRAMLWVQRGAYLATGAALLLIVHQIWDVTSTTNQGVLSTANSLLLSTAWGQWAIIRLLALAAVSSMVRSGFRLTVSKSFITATVLVAVVSQAAGSHAAGLDSAIFSIANDSVHLAASAAWIGGVFILWRVLRVQGSQRPDRIASEALSLFSPFAAAAVAVIVITGLFAIGGQVQSVDALIGTFYGRTLMVKLVVVGVALLLALRVRSGICSSGSSTRIGREAAVGIMVLATAAVLTVSVPANGTTWLPVTHSESRQLAVVQDDIQMGLTVTPNVPGQNLVLVDATNTRRPAPAPIDRVLVRIEPVDIDVAVETIEVEPTGNPGEYQVATTRFGVPGAYNVELVVRRVGLPDVVSDFDWAVANGSNARDVVLSDRELRGITSLAGVAGAALFLGVLLWLAASASSRSRRVKSLESYLVHDERNRRRVDP